MSEGDVLYRKVVGIQQRMQLECTNKDIEEMTAKHYEEKPYIKNLYQIRAMMRSKFKDIDDDETIKYLEKCYNLGVSIKGIRAVVLDCETWEEWLCRCKDFINEYDKQDDEEKVRALFHDREIRELKLNLEKEFEKVLDELCENGFIRYKSMEDELISIDLSTRDGQLRADRLNNNLSVIDEVYREISNTLIRVEIKIEDGKLIPIIKC